MLQSCFFNQTIWILIKQLCYDLQIFCITVCRCLLVKKNIKRIFGSLSIKLCMKKVCTLLWKGLLRNCVAICLTLALLVSWVPCKCFMIGAKTTSCWHCHYLLRVTSRSQVTISEIIYSFTVNCFPFFVLQFFLRFQLENSTKNQGALTLNKNK